MLCSCRKRSVSWVQLRAARWQWLGPVDPGEGYNRRGIATRRYLALCHLNITSRAQHFLLEKLLHPIYPGTQDVNVDYGGLSLRKYDWVAARI